MDADRDQPESATAVADRDGRPEVAERAESAAAEKLAEADGVLEAELDELFSAVGGEEGDEKPLDPTDELIQHLSVESQDDPEVDEELADGDALDELLGELQSDTPAAPSEPAAKPAESAETVDESELDALFDEMRDADSAEAPAAEADVAAPEPEPVQATEKVASKAEGLEGELNELFDAIETGVVPDDPEPAASVAAEPAEQKDGIDGELDELFDAMQSGEVPPDAEPVAESVAEDDSPDAAALRAEMAIDEAPAPAKDVAETAPADDPVAEDEPADPPVADTAPSDTADDPWWVKALIIANRPLDNLSDAHRDAVGKIGIVTLANALALIVYTLVIR
ncbi:MAG: hypothetical protein AAGD32_08205 [Planctomycetota bacterium]